MLDLYVNLTGSGANLLAASLIAGAIGTDIFFSQWMEAAFPVAILLMIIGWFIGVKVIFPLKPEERKPQIEGGMDSLKKELKKIMETEDNTNKWKDITCHRLEELMLLKCPHYPKQY